MTTDWRPFPARLRPKRQEFYLLRRVIDSIVEVVPDTRQVDATNVHKLYVGRSLSDAGLQGDQLHRALDFFAHCIRSSSTVNAPPCFQLPGCEAVRQGQGENRQQSFHDPFTKGNAAENRRRLLLNLQ